MAKYLISLFIHNIMILRITENGNTPLRVNNNNDNNKKWN